MKKQSYVFSNIVVLLLLPYLITILINGYDMAVLNQKRILRQSYRLFWHFRFLQIMSRKL